MYLKKYLLLAALTLSSICNAQNHAIFLDEEINGPANQLANRLAKKGYAVNEKSNATTAYLDGPFMGEQTQIVIFTTTEQNTAAQLMVLFPSWWTMRKQMDFFAHAEARLERLYGRAYLESDEYDKETYKNEQAAFRAGELLKVRYFNIENGEMRLQLSGNFVSITFTDTANMAKGGLNLTIPANEQKKSILPPMMQKRH